MAERRMFSKSVIGSARFLRMPASSRLLYYDLGMQADDDGIVEAFAVMRTTGATEDDLRVLASREFIRVLNDDLVSYICDWDKNNYVRGDRYRPSIYQNLLVKICDDNQTETNGLPSDNQMETQVRLGKDRLGKDSKESTAPPAAPPTPSEPKKSKPVRHEHGRYGWVKLSDGEYSCLLNELGESELERCIAYVDESAQSTGNKNKWRDWNLVIRRCHRDGWGLGKGAKKSDEPFVYDPGDTSWSL